MDDLTILGIDPDTKKISVVETRNGKQRRPTVHTIPINSTDPVIRNGIVFRGLGAVISDIEERDGRKPVLYLEAPVMGAGGPGATIPQAFVSGAILTVADEWSCRLHLVNNQSWKKRACGAGNINKEEVARRMADIWPELIKLASNNQDLIDAGAINIYGRKYQELIHRLKKRIAKSNAKD